MRTWLIPAATCLGLLTLAVATVPAYQLVVTAEDGQRLWALPVRPGTPVVLAYINSIYRAPTEELFTLTPAGFTLTSIRSTSEAVLAYNALPGPYVREGAFLAAPARTQLLALVLRIGQTGRQRLLVGRKELPLYTAGVGTQIRVEVTPVPILLQMIGRPRLR